MNWYLVQTKPHQETRALINLERQGFECYLPLLTKEKRVGRKIKNVKEPLFPRYLFVRLDPSQQGKSFHPIKSTIGVSKLVLFGDQLARAQDSLIEYLKNKEMNYSANPLKIYTKGEKLTVSEGAFSGFEVVYQMSRPYDRAVVLIELLRHPTELTVSISSLRKLP